MAFYCSISFCGECNGCGRCAPPMPVCERCGDEINDVYEDDVYDCLCADCLLATHKRWDT